MCFCPSLSLVRCLYKLTTDCRISEQQDSRKGFKNVVQSPYGNDLLFDLVPIFLEQLAGLPKMILIILNLNQLPVCDIQSLPLCFPHVARSNQHVF